MEALKVREIDGEAMVILTESMVETLGLRDAPDVEYVWQDTSIRLLPRTSGSTGSNTPPRPSGSASSGTSSD